MRGLILKGMYSYGLVSGLKVDGFLYFQCDWRASSYLPVKSERILALVSAKHHYQFGPCK
jgi:hypothetical protein